MQVDSDELVGLDIPLCSIFKPSWPDTSHALTVAGNAAGQISQLTHTTKIDFPRGQRNGFGTTGTSNNKHRTVEK